MKYNDNKVNKNNIFISENLKKLRKKHNLSTTEVGKIIGKTRQGYLNYENGTREIGINDLIKLSGFYNVPIDVIVSNPFTLKNNHTLAFRSFEQINGELKEIMPITISTIHDDIILVKKDDLNYLFFWKTNVNHKGHVMFFEYYNKHYVSKVYFNSYGGGLFFINDEPFYFNKAHSENLYFKGVYMSKLVKEMDINNFF